MLRLFRFRFLLTLIVFSLVMVSCDDCEDEPTLEPEVTKIPTNGLVAYYPFDGNSDDVVGGFDGTDTDVEYPTVNDSVVVDIDGADSYVQLGDDFDFEDRTVSVKINAAMSTDGLHVVYGSDHIGTQHGSTIISVSQETGKLILNINLSNNIYIQQLKPGDWYHIGVTLDGMSYKYFVNGENVYSGTIAVYNHAGNGVNAATVGASRVFDRSFFGYIDALRIYNRALSETEIETLSEN